MPAYKDTNGTYFVSFYYEDFRGVKKRKMKRGFARTLLKSTETTNRCASAKAHGNPRTT